MIRNIPCFKCRECDETHFTGDVAERIEKLIAAAKALAQDLTVIDYSKAA